MHPLENLPLENNPHLNPEEDQLKNPKLLEEDPQENLLENLQLLNPLENRLKDLPKNPLLPKDLPKNPLLPKDPQKDSKPDLLNIEAMFLLHSKNKIKKQVLKKSANLLPLNGIH